MFFIMLFFVSASTDSSAFSLMKGYIFSAFFEMYILDKTVVIIYMYRYRIKFLVVNNTDNLLISFFVGIVEVGCYSNYYLVIGSIKQVLNEAVDGISASVGNLGVTSDTEHIKKVYKAALLFNHWVFGLCSVCVFELISPFVELSFGKQFVFHYSIVFILCLNFYIQGIEKASNIFHNSLGLFWFDRYKSIIEAPYSRELPSPVMCH